MALPSYLQLLSCHSVLQTVLINLRVQLCLAPGLLWIPCPHLPYSSLLRLLCLALFPKAVHAWNQMETCHVPVLPISVPPPRYCLPNVSCTFLMKPLLILQQNVFLFIQGTLPSQVLTSGFVYFLSIWLLSHGEQESSSAAIPPYLTHIVHLFKEFRSLGFCFVGKHILNLKISSPYLHFHLTVL